jgi:alpha-mannosidase
VRHVSGGTGELLSNFKSPFKVLGASNVFLETIKRGDGDKHDSETTVILRLYEAYGGHARVALNIGSQLSVQKAFVTNLLEDELDELNILRADDTEHTAAILMLEFRGFEVKTVKLVIGSKESAHSAPRE